MTTLSKQRFLALDVFRGLTICLMIIVNTGGPNPFPPLNHAEWHGFTITDLVFPSFLFAVGNSLSFVKTKWDTWSNKQVILKVLKRTFLIFLIGYLMYWFPFVKLDAHNNIAAFPIGETRILGVLQRIALCYGIVALMVRFCSIKTIIITAIVLLVGYWMLMLGFGDYSVTGNAATKLDVLLLTPQHMYIKHGDIFEPEGLLSTLPSMVNVIAGYLCGYYIRSKQINYELLAKLAMAGIAAVCIGYFWDMIFPINKKLWTSSFVLYTVGLDCLIIVFILYWVDLLGRRKGVYFFEVFGKNALFIYLVSELIPIFFYSYHAANGKPMFRWMYDKTWGLIGNGHIPSLLWSLSFMLFCWLVGYWLDKKRIYVKL